MNVTQQERRIQALYDDANVSRRYLCERVVHLEADMEELRKELTDIHTLHWNGLDCTECPWFDECDTTGGCPWLGILTDHMRKLGIEVDE